MSVPLPGGLTTPFSPSTPSQLADHTYLPNSDVSTPQQIRFVLLLSCVLWQFSNTCARSV